ncbi:unnamed protein product [Arctogadus glacialis]
MSALTLRRLRWRTVQCFLARLRKALPPGGANSSNSHQPLSLELLPVYLSMAAHWLRGWDDMMSHVTTSPVGYWRDVEMSQHP